MLRLYNRLKYCRLARRYPPLMFPHLGEAHALSLAEQDANVAFLKKVASDRIACLRAFLCEVGTPMPDIFDVWHAQRSYKRLFEVFHATVSKSEWQRYDKDYPFYNYYYQPLAGQLNFCAALVDFTIMIADLLIQEGTCNGWEAYQRDDSGRLATRRSDFGEPFLTLSSGGSFNPAITLGNWRIEFNRLFEIYDSRGFGNSLAYIKERRSEHWIKVRENDASAGVDVIGRDMTDITTNWSVAPKGLPFAPATKLRALTPAETAIQAEARADYMAFYARLNPKKLPPEKVTIPKPFAFPKVWKEKGKYRHNLTGYNPPDLAGVNLWYDEGEKYDNNDRLLAIWPKRCAEITALLNREGIEAAPTAEAWDNIGDWLTRVLEPNREGNRPHDDMLLEDPARLRLFRPLHHAVITDLSILLLEHLTQITDGKIVQLWHIRRGDHLVGTHHILTAFAPVQRKVLDSIPPKHVTDAFVLDFLNGVFPFAVSIALKAIESEYADEWAEGEKPRFLGDWFRNITDLAETRWDEASGYELARIQDHS